MPVAPPREAASLILLRGEDPFEVLMLARHPRSRFAPGAWVFPGGAVEAGDGAGPARLRAAAVRELAEEAGVRGVLPADLIPFARWIAPKSLPLRFDTHFFLARAPAAARARPDGVECVQAGWVSAAAALARAREGRMHLLFPTRKQLERVSEFASAAALLQTAAEAAVVPVQPRLRVPGDVGEPLLPGEPGYETATG
jgi:8-oxo-dGTP pyrophosphatase MutT (NUDIX family)